MPSTRKPATSAWWPGTNTKTNPNAMTMIGHDTLYTNVALLPDGDVWWEGKTREAPPACIDWTGKPWTPDCGRPAAHPNSRFTTPMANNPVLDPKATIRKACPSRGSSSAAGAAKRCRSFIRRSTGFMASTWGPPLGRRRRPPQRGKVGVVRSDPMGDGALLWVQHQPVFHALDSDAQEDEGLSRAFSTSTGSAPTIDGRFLWPGFSENMRVLEWIINRCQGRAYAAETILGWMPRAGRTLTLMASTLGPSRLPPCRPSILRPSSARF